MGALIFFANRIDNIANDSIVWRGKEDIQFPGEVAYIQFHEAVLICPVRKAEYRKYKGSLKPPFSSFFPYPNVGME